MSNIQRIQRDEARRATVGDGDGGQHPWVWAVGLPYRTLAAPDGVAVMPAAPTPRTDVLDAVGYFATLQSFLTYSFGWMRHDKGLIWWCDAGMPVEDPRFALIRDVWVADGLLDTYIDWCTKHPVLTALYAFAGHVDRQPIDVIEEWRRRLPGQPSGEDPTSAYGKHLENGDHIRGPSAPAKAGAARLVDAVIDDRSATLVSETVSGWYSSLAALGSALPPLADDRNWRVDVYAKPIGFLGTFRRSRATGLWFAGRHRHHLLGN